MRQPLESSEWISEGVLSDFVYVSIDLLLKKSSRVNISFESMLAGGLNCLRHRPVLMMWQPASPK